MREKSGPIFLVIAFGAMLGFVAFLIVGPRDAGGDTAAPQTTVTTMPGDNGGDNGPDPTDANGDPVTTTSIPDEQERAPGTVPGWTVGQPWGTVEGLTTFRGNPTRTYYGTGPISDSPSVRWTYPGSWDVQRVIQLRGHLRLVWRRLDRTTNRLGAP
jgi:hypothetical protein